MSFKQVLAERRAAQLDLAVQDFIRDLSEKDLALIRSI